ncbi:hypothetical protein AJ79_07285 [Helicocarpus griseus UAMH5409]|uniref:Zn(2)-C6 fungal-type domain-containing protein n=1 Tax=Helicocarpus griseus UAMH5409 TaxID=1447875 RepID=A0A2B7X4J5_9EURO|nr:hypothetical protein AJ79_07285 [Helicocarpus griseus UAMH5409]
MPSSHTRSTASTPQTQHSAGVKSFSSTPCYTCRRRRVTCDRLLPSCQKCRAAQRTCLGYKKPITWVRGVASRGKMMGLTFDDVTARNSQALGSGRGDIELGKYQRTEVRHDGESDSIQEGPQGSMDWSQVPGLGDWGQANTSDSVTGCQRGDIMLLDRSSEEQTRNDEDILSPESHSYTPSILVDPLYQGLDKVSRYYLAHYDRVLCRLMVLIEVPNNNPYRRLLQMVNASPALCAATVAVGACHNLHALHYSGQSSFYNATSKHRTSSEDGEEFRRSPNPNVRSTYQHMLMFKHRALHHLKRSLSDPKTRRDEVTIATVLLLIILDMVESGRGAWKLHVEGAKKLLETRLGSPSEDTTELSALTYPACDSFNIFLAGTCMTFDIMGSTLSPSGTWTEPILSQLTESPNLLSDTEKNMFLGCPAYLLRIILFISSLRHADSSPRTLSPKADIATILSHINAFEPGPWAQKMQQSVSTNSAELPISEPYLLSRLSPAWNSSLDSPKDTAFPDAPYHLASAYKIAITLYATRILLHPSPEESPSFAEQVTSVLTHISHISPTCELFKSILWPTFIAGTECRCPQQRVWIRDRLEQQWRGFWTVNIRAASRVLDAIWSREDQYGGDWVEYIDRSDVNWLFI